MVERARDRLARLVVRPHLPRRTIRLRLTAVYGGLFLLSGAGLLAITYTLVWHATAGSFSYRGPNGTISGFRAGPHDGPAVPSRSGLQVDGPTATRTPLSLEQTRTLARQLENLAADQHARELHQLLLQSGIALGIMAVLSIALGWLVAGRVLRPLRSITEMVHDISATRLHERLALRGPDDELRRLGDTFDGLLARLDGAFDAQRRFVANASHELRTPLTVVRALLQMTLTDPDATVGSFRATCRDVLAEGEHQERLIEALLVLARGERGLDRRDPFDLSAVTDAVLRTRHPVSDRLGLRLQTGTAPAWVDGDARLADRLVTNLIDNALGHNVAGGRVEVTTGARAGRAFLAVTNTGPIVPPTEVRRLFQPFQRLGADSTGHREGLGLGLSIVQAIADAHGAALAAHARPDGGLDIEVSFPPSIASATYRPALPAPAYGHLEPSQPAGPGHTGRRPA